MTQLFAIFLLSWCCSWRFKNDRHWPATVQRITHTHTQHTQAHVRSYVILACIYARSIRIYIYIYTQTHSGVHMHIRTTGIRSHGAFCACWNLYSAHRLLYTHVSCMASLFCAVVQLYTGEPLSRVYASHSPNVSKCVLCVCVCWLACVFFAIHNSYSICCSCALTMPLSRLLYHSCVCAFRACGFSASNPNGKHIFSYINFRVCFGIALLFTKKNRQQQKIII